MMNNNITCDKIRSIVNKAEALTSSMQLLGEKITEKAINEHVTGKSIEEDQRVEFITERLKKQEFFFDPI